MLGFVVEVVRRQAAQVGFPTLPRRWVVERTLGWLTRFRRSVRGYERSVQSSAAMIDIVMTMLFMRRWGTT